MYLTSDKTAAGRRRLRLEDRNCQDAGFGLIEVVAAISILALSLVAIGWLIVSTLSVSNQAKQRATAAGLIQQVDSLFQTNVPALTCTNAVNYVSGTGSGTATRNGAVGVAGDNNTTSTTYTVSSSSSPASNGLIPITITVSWKPAATGQASVSLSNQLQVQCQ